MFRLAIEENKHSSGLEHLVLSMAAKYNSLQQADNWKKTDFSPTIQTPLYVSHFQKT